MNNTWTQRQPANGHGQPGVINVSVLERQIVHERIARRAYEIYESRGRTDGHADDDWVQAASEEAARRARARRPYEVAPVSDSLADRVRNARL
jgi:hypothetical protein